MSTTTGNTGAATKPAANKRPAHGPEKISYYEIGRASCRERV